ncbi:GNAT family N-acetyltransferase [Nonomuraea sp. NPDC050790]|uniref:GNAT family N-acetyltransferase n=1 Tax=Nonomuraea sp. NPDC050790 TaxID=3364371 RepID=UPI003791133D
MTNDARDAVLVAESLADAAAKRAGVTIEPAFSQADCAAASRLFDRVWNQRESSLLAPGALIALAHSGNYVAVARAGDRIVGAAAGFFGPPPARTLHSHLAGVLPELRGRGAGNALKLHQRHWALSAGATNITWTFDPLVARNAYLNVHRLGARVERYFENFYGEMGDVLNGHDASDRALANWDLLRACPPPPLADEKPHHLADEKPLQLADEKLRRQLADDEVRHLAGREPRYLLRRDGDRPLLDEPGPAEPEAGLLALQIPADIETLRRTNPAAASAWRADLRAAMTWALAEGWVVVDVRRDGCYLLERPAAGSGG